MAGKTCAGVSGVILAGGESRRMGEDKSFVRVSGRPLIDNVVDKMSRLFDDLIIVTNKPQLYLGCPARIERDALPGRGPLGGIYTGLLAAQNEHCFIVACDMPFVAADLIRRMVAVSKDFDAVVPQHDGLFEPLCAVYGRGCVEPILAQLRQGNLKVIDFYEHVSLKTVGSEEIARLDPLALSFTNINTPEDRLRHEDPQEHAIESVASGR